MKHLSMVKSYVFFLNSIEVFINRSSVPQLVCKYIFMKYYKNQYPSFWWLTWPYSLEKGAFFFELGVLKQTGRFCSVDGYDDGAFGAESVSSHCPRQLVPHSSSSSPSSCSMNIVHLVVRALNELRFSEFAQKSDFFSLCYRLLSKFWATWENGKSDLLRKSEQRISH